MRPPPPSSSHRTPSHRPLGGFPSHPHQVPREPCRAPQPETQSGVRPGQALPSPPAPRARRRRRPPLERMCLSARLSGSRISLRFQPPKKAVARSCRCCFAHKTSVSVLASRSFCPCQPFRKAGQATPLLADGRGVCAYWHFVHQEPEALLLSGRAAAPTTHIACLLPLSSPLSPPFPCSPAVLQQLLCRGQCWGQGTARVAPFPNQPWP